LDADLLVNYIIVEVAAAEAAFTVVAQSLWRGGRRRRTGCVG
jgi:hypothetical protein